MATFGVKDASTLIGCSKQFVVVWRNIVKVLYRHYSLLLLGVLVDGVK